MGRWVLLRPDVPTDRRDDNDDHHLLRIRPRISPVIVGAAFRYRADCHAKTRAQNVIRDLFQILLNA